MIDDLLTYIQNTIVRYLTCVSPEPQQTEQQDQATDVNSQGMQDCFQEFGMDLSNKSNPSLSTGLLGGILAAAAAAGGVSTIGGQQQSQPSIVLNVEQFIRDVEDRPAIWNRNYHCNKQFLEKQWEELSAIHKLTKQTLKTKWKGLRDNFRVEYKRIPRNENGDMIIPPETHESKWTHYHALLFLTDHMRHRQPKHDSSSEPFYYKFPPDPDEYEQHMIEPDLPSNLITIGDDSDQSNSPRHRLQMNGVSVTIQPRECSSNDSALYSNGGSHIGNGGGGGGYSNRESLLNAMAVNGIPPLTIKRKRSSNDSEDLKSAMLDGLVEPDDDYHYLLSLYPYMKELNASQKLRLRTKIQKLIFKELYKEDLEETK